MCADAGRARRAVRRRCWPAAVEPPTHRTACLITYGDGIRRPGETPLHTLAGFLDEHVGDVVSDVHLLPMFPWTSDDGFAVVDHREVNPALGTLGRRRRAGRDHALMFDFVANHTSSSSPWFTGWLARDPRYDGFYLERDPDFDDSLVVARAPLRCTIPSRDRTARRRGRGRRSARTRSTSTSASRARCWS